MNNYKILKLLLIHLELAKKAPLTCLEETTKSVTSFWTRTAASPTFTGLLVQVIFSNFWKNENQTEKYK